MATLSYQTSTPNGVALTLVAANGGGDQIPARNNGVVVVKNGDSSSTNVTVVTPGNDQYGNARPDVVVAVAAGATTVIGPFAQDLVDSTTHRVGLTYSKVTSLTVGGLAI